MSKKMTWSNIGFLNCLPTAMLIFDHQHKIVFANDEAVKLYGYSPEEFKNIYITDLKIHDNKLQIENVIMKYFFNEQKKHRIITKHKIKEKKIIDVDVETITIEIDNEIFLLESIREFTEQQEVLRTYERAVDLMSKVVKNLTEED